MHMDHASCIWPPFTYVCYCVSHCNNSFGWISIKMCVQVSNWFINARVRLWKPMIEEMYQQECKELEGSSGAGDDPSGADDTHSPTTTAAAHHQHRHGQLMVEHGGASSGGGAAMSSHKHEPGVVAGPSSSSAAAVADAAFVGIDPVELLGGDGAAADDLYGRFDPAGAAAAAGDVSLTLGLQHAGAGNAGPDGSGRFSLRDYSGC